MDYEITQLTEFYNTNLDRYLADYFTLLRFQSVSSEPEFKSELDRCIDWLSKYLSAIGFQIEIWKTSGHPVIFASRVDAGQDKPTVLIYNHYDVQPVDPLEEWETPPFEPVVRDGSVYARGAQDNKGQLMYVLQALEALIKLEGKLPVNVKLCIEGEEEVGSVGLSELLEEKKELLKADYLIVADVGIPDLNTPAVTLGVRGIITMDVIATSTSTDLHSGQHGGIVFNPIHALVQIFSDLRDSSGKIKIPHFYDDVRELPEGQKDFLLLDFNHDDYLKEFGTVPSGGEEGYSPYERAWLRPTIEINGISGGYTGTGFKTVIPAKAMAKVSCRLVPNQDPSHIGKLVADYIESHAPDGVKVEVIFHKGGGSATRANPDSPIVKALVKGYSEVFGKPAKFILQGGSIPVTTKLAEVSLSEPVFMGLGLSTDKIHAPNEHFGLDRLMKGFLVIARALQILGG